MSFEMPPNEAARIAALQSLEILDTAPEAIYDDVVRLAAAICRTPIAIINFVDADRQWGKALVGLECSEAPREASFCARTILTDSGMLVVPDTHLDGRFAQNPQVTGDPNLRFYAGATITTSEGHALGSICVADREPRELDDEALSALRVLARQIASHLELRRRTAQLEDAAGELRRLALHDGLTGLPNRTLLMERLAQHLREQPRGAGGLALLFGDLNGFKAYNDTFGHEVGDRILRDVGRRLRSASRQEDTVARLAGDEFLVLCPGVANRYEAQLLAERLEIAVNWPIECNGATVVPEISIGTAVAVAGDAPDDLLRRADFAMYDVKQAAKRPLPGFMVALAA